MSRVIRAFRMQNIPEGIGEEVVGLLIGGGFTLLLLGAMAHFENRASESPPAKFEDLRKVSVPLDPPPPEVQEIPQIESPAPLARIEIGVSDSPVKITVVPVDFESFIPTSEVPPTATIQTNQLYTNFKPQINIGEDFQRVFQKSEVDRMPAVSYRPNPSIPQSVRQNAGELRVTTLLIVDAQGAVISVRVLRSSGNKEFDAIIIKSIKENWEFTPAIRKGKKVKCLIEQGVTVQWRGGSPFTM